MEQGTRGGALELLDLQVDALVKGKAHYYGMLDLQPVKHHEHAA